MKNVRAGCHSAPSVSHAGLESAVRLLPLRLSCFVAVAKVTTRLLAPDLHGCWGSGLFQPACASAGSPAGLREEEEQAGVDYDDVTTSPHYDCYDHLQLHCNTSGGTLDLEEILKGHKDSGTEISTDAALRSADPSLLLLLLSLTMVQLYRLL
ncbi:hypothetical protein JZ751_007228 [Albula glossodonta]|uniref:Uncharacterized protein n=1 Tax=Albula glossodonta TaxID=121402 RepID=A0A8T2N3E2_9TELE|nr:hypothetical protein JZ751_007228 [Albula glossodonta]